MDRKSIHNNLTRKMETYPRDSLKRRMLDVLRLGVWCLPIKYHLLYFIETQLPDFVSRLDKCTMNERRFKQRLFGTASSKFRTLEQITNAFRKINWQLESLKEKAA